ATVTATPTANATTILMTRVAITTSVHRRSGERRSPPVEGAAHPYGGADERRRVRHVVDEGVHDREPAAAVGIGDPEAPRAGIGDVDFHPVLVAARDHGHGGRLVAAAVLDGVGDGFVDRDREVVGDVG